MSNFENLSAWLVEHAPRHRGLEGLLDVLLSQLVGLGMPIGRINLGVLAIHPVMAGYATFWEEGMNGIVEVPIALEDTLKPVYLDSPIRHVVENRTPVNFSLDGDHPPGPFPVLSEYRDKGYTQYLGFPIPYGDGAAGILTICTRQPGGFAEEHRIGIEKLFGALGLLIHVVETERLARTVMRTYLGRDTGERVLAGKIRRGEGEHIQAALWLCDLRGFTAMTAEQGERRTIEAVNVYFDCMSDAVWAGGGEILKFMGDALLAVFRIDEEMSPALAAQAALNAAVSALRNLEKVSAERISTGASELRAGIAIHLGQVLYGNIGASSRLDFTVMGNAVNLVSRLQDLTGKFGEKILFSAEVHQLLVRGGESLGHHALKGVREAVEVFRPHGTTPSA